MPKLTSPVPKPVPEHENFPVNRPTLRIHEVCPFDVGQSIGLAGTVGGRRQQPSSGAEVRAEHKALAIGCPKRILGLGWTRGQPKRCAACCVVDPEVTPSRCSNADGNALSVGRQARIVIFGRWETEWFFAPISIHPHEVSSRASRDPET